MGAKPRRKAIRVLASDMHPRLSVDPFGLFPCECSELTVHTTTGHSLGDDLVECKVHKTLMSLREMFAKLGVPEPPNL